MCIRDRTALARRLHVTPNSVVMAAWALMLARWSGEPEVLFGVTVSGRSARLPGIEAMVGLLINTLPLRLPFRPATPMTEWLVEVRDRQGEILAWESTPLVEVQKWSEVAAGQPLFEALYAFENFTVDAAVQRQNLPFEVADVRVFEQTNYPMTLMVVPGETLTLRLSWDGGQLEPGTAERTLGHLRSALEGMIQDPGQPLGAFSLLAAAERHQLLVEWNDTATPYDRDATLDALFLARAACTPEACLLYTSDAADEN